MKPNAGGSGTKSSPRIQRRSCSQPHSSKNMNSLNSRDKGKNSPVEFEVAKLVDICYGDPNDTGKCGLHFQVGLMWHSALSMLVINLFEESKIKFHLCLCY